ncbi:hypothetical protein [Bacteroides uniformis]|uniref:hypothetical protein n=1 Tax=Bacteroides uniformis TaxID=820 RepID=UPI003F274FDB
MVSFHNVPVFSCLIIKRIYSIFRFKLGIKLDDITSTDGRNFYKAMDFLASYVGKGLSEWPYQQISGWESSIQNFCKDLYRTAVYLNPARKDYLNLYYAHRILKPHDNFNLLYIQATALDNPIRK